MGMRKRIGSYVFAAIAACGIFLSVSVSPAAAGTCSTPGCGGVVTNGASQSIAVANCWSGTGTRNYSTNLPSSWCPNGWSTTKAGAMMNLGRGDSTYGYSKYYDTDAFRVYAGCRVVGNWGGASGSQFVFDRRGLSSMWVKITDWDNAYIRSITC